MPKYGEDIFKDIELDEELQEYVDKFKDKKLTTAEMDLKIQADKIIYIINRSLAKLNVMCHMPHLLEDNAELLKRYLKPSEVFYITDVLSGYGAELDYDSSYSGESLQDLHMIRMLSVRSMPSKALQAMSKTGFDPIPDPQIHLIFDIMFYNRCLRQEVNTTENTRIDKVVKRMMKVMVDLKNLARLKIYVSGEEEAAMDRELRNAYKTNALMIVSINELTEHLDKQRKELGEQLDKKVHVMEMYNEKMVTLKENFQARMKKCLHESERDMMNKTVESEAKQASLAEDAKKITQHYEALLEDNLHREKLQRSKRYKVETQLQNWLTKFDQDIGDRLAEYEALKKKYDDEKAEMTELEERFDEQEDEYDILMAEKQEEEDRIFGEMAYEFLINRSARKIQRWWRAYLERKRARRKARRGKGKGGKGGKAKEKKEKEQPAAADPRSNRAVDPNAMLESGTKKFGAGVFDELKDPNAFDTKDAD